jgi:hypothetical protein
LKSNIRSYQLRSADLQSVSMRGGVVPLGMLTATQLYLYDINEGVSGFTGEPMPGEVVGMPQVMGSIVQMAVEDVARDAFGDEYADELLKIQREIRDSATS